MDSSERGHVDHDGADSSRRADEQERVSRIPSEVLKRPDRGRGGEWHRGRRDDIPLIRNRHDRIRLTGHDKFRGGAPRVRNLAEIFYDTVSDLASLRFGPTPATTPAPSFPSTKGKRKVRPVAG